MDFGISCYKEGGLSYRLWNTKDPRVVRVLPLVESEAGLQEMMKNLNWDAFFLSLEMDSGDHAGFARGTFRALKTQSQFSRDMGRPEKNNRTKTLTSRLLTAYRQRLPEKLCNLFAFRLYLIDRRCSFLRSKVRFLPSNACLAQCLKNTRSSRKKWADARTIQGLPSTECS